jgi:DNA polymerase (family 10)
LENRDFARILNETADLMEISGEDGFRIRSYRNGATAIEGHTERVSDILRDPERKVTDISGIGKGLAFVLNEIEARGSCEMRDTLLLKFPACALEFLKIQGLGPKGVKLLFEHFELKSMDELEQLCRDQKLRDLPRMGKKLEEKVLRSIEQHKMRSGRFLLSYADNTAQELMEHLASVEGIDAITPAGRRLETWICWSPDRMLWRPWTRWRRTPRFRRFSDGEPIRPA